MLKPRWAPVCLVLAGLLAPAPSAPETADKYQVTGPVLELTDTKIVVQKDKDRWEVARDASTKVTGDLKVGSRVTIKYRMVATSVEVKTDTAAKKSK